VIAAICAGLAAAKLRRPAPHFPSLTSRLRVAIKTNPIKPDQAEAVRDTAASILMAPSAPVTQAHRKRRQGLDRNMQVGLALTATLLGWAAARRRRQARRTAI
jgi:hypothetical protein